MASGAALLAGIAALLVFALSTQGYRVRHVDLNDGGIWVTSSADGVGGSDGLFGRLNRPAGSLDAAMYPATPGGSALDVRQDGAVVVAWDKTEGKLYPVDVVRSVVVKDHGVPVGATDQVELAGGTLAILDPASGNVFAERVDVATGIVDLTTIDPSGTPVATVDPPNSSGSGSPAALAVSPSGTVYAASTSGKVVSIAASGAGFAGPQYSQLAAGLTSIQVTAVGSQFILLDPIAGTVILPGGRTVHLDADPKATLQAPTSSGSTVVVATSKALISVDLGSGHTNDLTDAGTGAPARPTWLGDCVYSAWAGHPGAYQHSCGGGAATPGNVADLKELDQPVFRVNRNSIVLNDLHLGTVIDLESGQRVDNWKQVKPPPVQQKSDKTKSENPTTSHQDQPPKAVDDQLGARPGRTTMLHVLDNDSDPQGYILSVTSVTPSDNPAATVSVAPDGQTVLISLGSDTTATHFKYTVDDGKGLSATANVTVEARSPDQNTPPRLRTGFSPQSWNVAAGGSLSLPVLGDWRDDDGDPVVLVSASVPAGSVTTTPDGRVNFTAGMTPGPQTVTYQVSDGIAGSDPVPGTIAANVLKLQSSTTTAAIAEPDVARGIVGQPITIHPLDNDLPGTDPTNPIAKLALAGALSSVEGTSITSDTKTGIVTVVATRPATFLLTYSVAFGNAPFAEGKIRVDVASPPSSPLPPVAVPDNAVIYGQAPNTVDVLANDFDPSGQLLVVQHAAPVEDNGQLQVAIIQGHWLRISALRPTLSPNPELVRYTISDGTTSATTGEVTVTQLPPPVTDTPVPQDDYTIVRAGDSVAVPVLDNDTTPGGDPISLVPAVVPKSPGELVVTSSTGTTGDANGKAYVSGRVVRYVAPPTVDTQQTMTIDYVAQDPAGDQATGHLHVTITPAPSDTNPDLPPAPQPIEARVVAGDTVSIAVPTSGVDPEGDSVTAEGITSAAALGRVTAIGATSITYEAFPTSAGTDSFGYTVTDTFGQTGKSTIRIAVVPPGDPQPPVAVDDQLTAAPGATAQVDVIANDLIAPDDNVTIKPAGGADVPFPNGVSLLSPTGPIQVTAPAQDDGKPLVVLYSIDDGIGAPSVATLTVRAKKDYNNPPVAVDAYAQPSTDATSVTVDVLGKDYDPEGTGLTVTKVNRSDATVDGGNVTVPVTDHPQTIAYEISDGGSPAATAIAAIHVPPLGGGAAPYVKAGQTITMDKDAAKTINIADYVVDPAGKPLRLTTTDQISAAPGAGLKAANAGDTQLVLNGQAGYVGPAAISFEVTDGSTLNDGVSAFLTIAVQVGPETPVLRCPANPLTVLEGGTPVRVDVASVCHVWVANKADLPNLKFDASWNKNVDGVSIDGSGSHTLTISASGSARPGDGGEIKIDVSGTSATSATLAVVVAAAPPPTVTPVTIDGFKDGSTATIDLTSYVASRLRDPKISVVSITQTSGMDSTSSAAGSSVSITPGAKTFGVVTFSVVVTDVADTGRTDRNADGTITMNVLNRPDPPTNVAPDRAVLSHVVQLSWTTPPNNGAPIDNYEVDYTGGSQNCAASPCTITGLTNGTDYTFTVKAHNLIDFSDPSAPSPSARPDSFPDAVTGLAVSQPLDGNLTLTWTAAHVDGTPVDHYLVAWGGGGSQQVPGSQTTMTATGLVNDNKYTFTVIPVNQLGPGAPATVQGESAGKPAAPGQPTFTATNDTADNTRVAIINWGAVDPNGIAPTSYAVNRSSGNGGSTKLTCASTTTTTCRDSGITLDGTIYQYSITAMNAAAATDPIPHTSAAGPTRSMEASATPDDIKSIATHVGPSTPDGQVPVTFDAGASHGKSSTVSCSYSLGACGSTTVPTGGQSGVPMTLTFTAGWSGSFILTDCNASSQSDQAGNTCNGGTASSASSNGPPNPPAGGLCSSDNGSTATFSWSQPAGVGARTVVSYNLSGAGSGNTGSTSYSIPVANDGVTHTLNVYSVDNYTPGEQSAGFISINCTDPAPPPSISASQGVTGTSSIGSCNFISQNCHWLNFTLSANFPTGNYQWQCITNGVVSYTGPTVHFAAGGSYGFNGTTGYCIWGSGTEAISINGIQSKAVAHF